MRVSRREVLSWFVGYGPAVACVVFALCYFGPAHGYWRTLGIALVVAIGALILWGVVLAWLPSTLEKLGPKSLARWLRDWWREDL